MGVSVEVVQILQSLGPGLYGITGPAASGKTTLSLHLRDALPVSIYSADTRFIGDSQARKALLDYKNSRGLDAYTDAANQFNWWDWDAIYTDLELLKMQQDVVVAAPYNRDTGKHEDDTVISGAAPYRLYEGAILGPPLVLNLLDKIFFLYTDPKERLNRLLDKDCGRRTFNEILARFLITEYSESHSYDMVFRWYRDKIITVGETTTLVDRGPHFIPVPIK